MKTWDLLGKSLQHDFCPWANAYVYWLKRPIGWFALAMFASLLLGIYVSAQAFLGLAAIAALCGIGCLWPWIVMIGLRGEVAWSQARCEEEDTIQTRLTIVNRWPWPAWGIQIELDQAIGSRLQSPDQGVCLSRVPALSQSEFVWDCQPKARGVYPEQKVKMTTAFPFGIWSHSREVTVKHLLKVWPLSVKLVDVPEHAGSHSSGIGSTSSKLGDEGDWLGVRPFRPGDSLRQVHWAQTARRDSLVVFERQSRTRQVVSIWFDEQAAVDSTGPQLEWMVRLLATTTNHFLAHNWHVRVHIDDKWQILRSDQTSKHTWMDHLAAWKPSTSTVVVDNPLASDSPLTKSLGSRSEHMLSGMEGLAILISTPTGSLRSHSSERSKTADQSVKLLVDSASLFSTSSMQSGSVDKRSVVLDAEDDPAANLQVRWRSVCQQASSMRIA